jgi:hypothetical protein
MADSSRTISGMIQDTISALSPSVTPGTAQTSPSDPGRFREVLDYVLPQPDETRWLEIPWQTDLWDARRVALQEGKPIFAWMMNGSVLGCT